MAPQRSNYQTGCRRLCTRGRVDGVWRWSPLLPLCLSDTAFGLWALSSHKGTESQRAPYGSPLTREMNHRCQTPSDGRSTGEILKLLCFSPLFYDKLYVVFHQQCNGLSFKYPYWDDIPTHLSQLYAESPTVGMVKQFWHWSVCCTIKHLITFINKWMDEDNCQTTCYCGRAQSPTLFPKQKQSHFCLHNMVDIFNDFLFFFYEIIIFLSPIQKWRLSFS